MLFELFAKLRLGEGEIKGEQEIVDEIIEEEEEEEEDSSEYKLLIGRLKEGICHPMVKLSHQQLTDEQVIELCSLLVKNTDDYYPVELNLSGNRLLNCAEALAKLIATNKTIKFLYLKNNQFDAKGLCLLGQAIANNSTLTIVDMSELYGKFQKTEGYIDLIKGLQQNKSITEFRLKRTGLNNQQFSQVIDAVADLITQNNVLRCLSLDCNAFDDNFLAKIAQALEYNTTLKSLALGISQGTKITFEGLRKFCSSVNKIEKTKLTCISFLNPYTQKFLNTSIANLDRSLNKILAEKNIVDENLLYAGNLRFMQFKSVEKNLGKRTRDTGSEESNKKKEAQEETENKIEVKQGSVQSQFDF